MSSVPKSCKRWVLQNKAVGDVDLSDSPQGTFKLEDWQLPELKDGQALVRILYISNDPAQKGWINKSADPRRLYRPPIEEGAPMASTSVIGRIAALKGDGQLKEGDLVIPQAAVWSEYVVVDQKVCRKVEKPEGAPLSALLGSLGGGTSLTGLFGLTEVLKFKEGESIIVSGAAGAVGSFVVQYAKNVLKAKDVIAIAGTDEKCRWLESLGATKTINYKTQGWEKKLAEVTPDFVECYFDNVGGPILTAALSRMKPYGRIAACGSISNYNSAERGALDVGNWFEVIQCKLTIRGFIVTDFMSQFAEGQKTIITAYKNGQIKIEGGETVVDTKGHFERVPEIWTRLFSGGNTGKLVTQIADA